MEAEKKLTGYPSIDKPWLKYYTEEAINADYLFGSAYDFLYARNSGRKKCALEYFGNKISFDKLFENIENTANAFAKKGIKKGNVVTVILPNIPEVAYIFYALSKIGAIANMVDPRTSTSGIEDYIKETNSSFIIILDLAVPKIVDISKRLNINTIVSVSPSESFPLPLKALYNLKQKRNLFQNVQLWKEFIKSGKSVIIQKPEDDFSKEPVMIVHTGGTTGMPKGVCLSNENINAVAFQSLSFPTDLKPEHKWLDIMPPFIAYGIGSGLHFPLAVGMTVILIPKFDETKFSELIIKHKPNHMAGVPSHWSYVINSPKMKKENLFYLISAAVGGDQMDEKLEIEANSFLKEHKCAYPITKGYGMTEVNGSVSRTLNENNPIGSVGVPFCNTIVSVFDPDTGEELKYNQKGEICISGPSAMLGYYGNDSETKLVKRTHKDGLEWIHSGDLGYMNEDGNLFVIGRIKRMIIRYDGFKVFPLQIEKAVMKCADVENCCAVGVSDKSHSQGKLPFVFAVKKKECTKSNSELADELIKICRDVLPEYEQPNGFKFIDKLPLTPIGKVDYRALEQEAENKE